MKVLETFLLSEKIKDLRKNDSLKIGLCHGVFDVIHFGHIEYFRIAKEKCDILIVSVTANKYVNKGSDRPYFDQLIRMNTLSALEMVDFVCLSESENSVEVIEALKPDFYFKGVEYKEIAEDLSGNMKLENDAVTRNGGQTIFENGQIFSSSNIINKVLNMQNSKLQSWIKQNKHKFELSEILNLMKEIRDLKVLIIGEAIIDQYIHCEALGKTSKSHIVAFKELRMENHLGGTLSIANNLAEFVNEVHIFTNNSLDELENLNLMPKLNKNITEISTLSEHLIFKRRYINYLDGTKLFETYNQDFLQFDLDDRKKQIKELLERIDDYDLVIVADYGHGLISDELIKIICDKSKFLALNVQSNAGNRGLNSISKYSKADYVSINGDELALETRRKGLDVESAAINLAKDLMCGIITVTNGKDGLLVQEVKTNVSTQIPALTLNVIDRVGAGDTVFLSTALFAFMKADSELIGFVGNIAGAMAVEVQGNNWTLSPSKILKQIEIVLK